MLLYIDLWLSRQSETHLCKQAEAVKWFIGSHGHYEMIYADAKWGSWSVGVSANLHLLRVPTWAAAHTGFRLNTLSWEKEEVLSEFLKITVFYGQVK